MNRYEKMNQERGNAKTRKRVAAYCRVSTDKGDQANSFESQQLYFKAYIDRMTDWQLVEIYADKGSTGTNTKKRPEFNRMIAAAKGGGFDLIVTKEVTRFARNTVDALKYTRELKKHDVYVIFVNDGIDTREPDAELRLSIMATIAQEESRKTSDRVKWGQMRQMEKGVVFGRNMLGYDVRGGELFINEEGAKIIRLIFHMCVNEGMGAHAIGRELREAGYKTITGRTKWPNATVYKILRNEKYCGDLVQKKTFTPDYLSHDKKYNKGEEEFVILKDHHEPIVSREMFEAANRMLDERSAAGQKSKHSNRYCFSGKLVCGYCGSKFSARYRTRKGGGVYKSWRCLEAAGYGRVKTDKAGNTVGCNSESIRNDDALHIMSLTAGSLAMDKDSLTGNILGVIQTVVSRSMPGADVDALRQRIELEEERKERLIELFMNKAIDRVEFVKKRTDCGKRIAELRELLFGIDKRSEALKRQKKMMEDITRSVNEIAGGIAPDEVFYRNLLDRMVLRGKGDVEVYLKLLEHKWKYAIIN